MTRKANIIIVDDHAGFREGVKLLIEMEELGTVIAEAENGQDFIDLLTSKIPDLVIIDLKMPVMGGLEATRKAISISPGLKILVVTMSNWKENFADITKAGVMGLVLKTSGKTILEKAIKAIIKGENYFIDEYSGE